MPVFLADVKGDLSGIAMAGSPTAKTHDAFAQRAKEIGEDDWAYADNPAIFWDLLGEQGHPIRTTVSEMGPLLLSQLLDLNEVQEGVLTVAFTLADKEGLLLLDLDDLGAMLAEIANRADELATTYGNVSKASVGTIQRALLQLRSQGGEHFFGEPALDIHDFMLHRRQGAGPDLDPRRRQADGEPEALLDLPAVDAVASCSRRCPRSAIPTSPSSSSSSTRRTCCSTARRPALLDKVEQVVRLIRSKGVGVYFITQNPIDVPDTVAGQLGNRVQHALRAFTPQGPEGGEGRRRDLPRQSRRRRRDRDHRIEGGRGAGLAAPARRFARRRSSAR